MIQGETNTIHSNAMLPQRMGFLFVIQARLGSTRLPQKVVRPLFEDTAIIDILIKRLKVKFPNRSFVLATGGGEENEPLMKLANHYSIGFYAGDESDVLNRYVSYINTVSFSGLVVRICADNPFLDMELLEQQLEFCVDNPNYDYYSYQINGVPSILTHYGIFAEVVAASALKSICETTKDMFYREHVTRYIYEHPGQYRIAWLDVSEQMQSYEGVRLTIDTPDDFSIAQKLFHKNPEFRKLAYSYKEVFQQVTSDEGLKNMMAEIISNTIK